jgi:hypothetical protein
MKPTIINMDQDFLLGNDAVLHNNEY